MDEVDRLIKYLQSLPNFRKLDPSPPVDHVGAIITDAVLQAGMNYERVVRKRVDAVKAIEAAATTRGFLAELRRRGPANVLAWQGGRKPQCALSLAELLHREGVDSVDDLRSWLQRAGSFSKLRTIAGIGPKTVDYLKILVGLPAVAVDVHLSKLLAAADVPLGSYETQRSILEGAADRLGMNRSAFDYSVWKVMANGGA
jgi:hypothetical protein